MRAWLAQLDRRLSLRTYLGAAAMILTIAAAAVAVVLAVDARDNSASQDDLNRVESQIATEAIPPATAEEAPPTDAAGLDQRLTTLEGRVDQLESSGTATEEQLTTLEDEIKELRGQLDGSGDGKRSSKAGGANP